MNAMFFITDLEVAKKCYYEFRKIPFLNAGVDRAIIYYRLDGTIYNLNSCIESVFVKYADEEVELYNKQEEERLNNPHYEEERQYRGGKNYGDRNRRGGDH